MKKILKFTMLSAILLTLGVGLTSCDKKENIFSELEMGLYQGVEPTQTFEWHGNIRINFIDDKRLTITKYIDNDHGVDVVQEEFMYYIDKNTIGLSYVEFGPGVLYQYYFRIINSRKFEIGYLYPFRFCGSWLGDIPPYPPNMIFERVIRFSGPGIWE